MNLFERGNLSPEIIENRIKTLEMEKKAIQDQFEGEKQVKAAIEYAEKELDDDLIRGYMDRFETLVNESNMDQMREFIKTFIVRMELHGRVKNKKRGRKVYIHSQIPALTGIELASPWGFEPQLQDRKS